MFVDSEGVKDARRLASDEVLEEVHIAVNTTARVLGVKVVNEARVHTGHHFLGNIGPRETVRKFLAVRDTGKLEQMFSEAVVAEVLRLRDLEEVPILCGKACRGGPLIPRSRLKGHIVLTHQPTGVDVCIFNRLIIV